MSTPPPPPPPAELNDPERLATLARTGLMDTGRDINFDRLTAMAARLTDCPIALVSLVDDQRQYFKSAIGLTGEIDRVRQTSLKHSFCRKVVEGRAPLIICDARIDRRVMHMPVVKNMRLVGYLGMPLKLAGGSILGSFCVIDHRPREWTDHEIQNIHDLAQAAATEAELRLTVSHQKDVMAVVSHDLKAPLSGIQLVAHNLHSRLATIPVPPAVPRMVGRIVTAAERMEEMVLQVLDHARHNAGRVVLNMQEHDASELVAEALRAMEPAAEARAIRLAIEGDEQAPMVHCDRGRSGQVLTNLLSNAIKHAPAGSSVTCRVEAQDNVVRIHVRDEGAGISEAQQQHLFDPFWQAPGTPIGGGHGVGLYSSAELARAQNGELAVESQLGAGSTFTYELRRPFTVEEG